MREWYGNSHPARGEFGLPCLSYLIVSDFVVLAVTAARPNRRSRMAGFGDDRFPFPPLGVEEELDARVVFHRGVVGRADQLQVLFGYADVQFFGGLSHRCLVRPRATEAH
ncbi:hypothetical protein ABZ746_12280 [Streptomyces sp. NPDC020096]